MSEKQIMTLLDNASLPDLPKQRKAIVELENIMLNQDQVEIPVKHLLHGGMYARAVTVPAGTLLTGHIYKFDHIEVMTSGTLMVTTDDGQSRLLEGFNLMPALSGKKRAAYAVEDTTWVTFHTVGDTAKMTGDQVQDNLTVGNFDELLEFYTEVNRADYALFLRELGITQRFMDDIVWNTDDCVEIELYRFGLEQKESPIDGQGIFATESFKKGVVIACCRAGEYRTQLGRYINHAVRPNCEFVDVDNDFVCRALQSISVGDELTVNYRNVLAMRSKVGDI